MAYTDIPSLSLLQLPRFCNTILRELLYAVHLAVEAVAERVADMEAVARIEVPCHALKEERYRALVDAVALEVGGVDEPDRYRRVDAVVQLLDAVVDVGRQERILVFDVEVAAYLHERCAHLHLEVRGCVLAEHGDFFSSHGFVVRSFLFQIYALLRYGGSRRGQTGLFLHVLHPSEPLRARIFPEI